MIILSIRLFFSTARRTNPEGLPQLSEACLYSNPSLLLSLRVFLTPPSLRTPPLYSLAKTPRKAMGHGRGGVKYLSSSLFYCCFNPSVTACHLPYILRCITQGRRVRVTLRSLRCNTPHTGHGRGEGEMYFPFASVPILYATPRNATGTAREVVGSSLFFFFL